MTAPDYAYRQLEVRHGRWLWAARADLTNREGIEDSAASWLHGFTRKQAIRRATRWAERQNRLHAASMSMRSMSRTYDRLAEIMVEAGDSFEGIVWHHPDGRMANSKYATFLVDELRRIQTH